MLSHVAQNNFTAGELSEWLDPRVDFPKYNNGLSVCENAIVRPQGGVFGRGGTIHVAPAKHHDKTTILIPFRFSKTDAYMLEFGEQYFRIYRNYAPVTTSATVNNISSDASGTVTLNVTSTVNFNSVRAVVFDSFPDYPQLVGRWEGCTYNVAAGTGTITIPGTPYISVSSTPTSATAAVVVEVATGFLASDLRSIKYAQTGDTLYLVHEDFPPSKVLRTSHTNWTLQVVNFADGPYFDTNTTATTIDPSATTGAITVTASAALFNVLHVGSIWRYSDAGTNWGYFEITGFTSSTLVNATVIQTLPGAAPASIYWREGMWSDYQGYPAAVAIYEQSSFWGGSPGAPQTFVKSVTDSPEDMTPGVLDDDAAVFTLGSGTVDDIRWMKGAETLIIGTEGSENSASGNNDGALTPTSIRLKNRTPHGSNHIDAVRVSDSVVFCQRTGRRVRSLSYQISVDKFLARDLGLLADHIIEDLGLVEMTYQQERHSVIWGIREDGLLIGITYLPDEEVIAWHRHPTYGDGAFQSVSAIPSPTYDVDDVWVVCNRTLNGAAYQSIEYMNLDNSGLDCAAMFNTAASTFFVPHLKNETVAAVADGVVYASIAVDNAGYVTFPLEYTNVRIGLPFTGKITTMKPEKQLPDGGTTQGLPRRWVQIRARVRATLGLTIAGEQIAYRKSSDLMDTAITPFTGDHVIRGASSFDEDGRITIEQTTPLPWAVTGIFGKVEFGVD